MAACGLNYWTMFGLCNCGNSSIKGSTFVGHAHSRQSVPEVPWKHHDVDLNKRRASLQGLQSSVSRLGHVDVLHADFSPLEDDR